jgi:hypothetical protein
MAIDGAGAVPYGWGTGCIGPNDVLLEDFQPALRRGLFLWGFADAR